MHRRQAVQLCIANWHILLSNALVTFCFLCVVKETEARLLDFGPTTMAHMQKPWCTHNRSSWSNRISGVEEQNLSRFTCACFHWGQIWCLPWPLLFGFDRGHWEIAFADQFTLLHTAPVNTKLIRANKGEGPAPVVNPSNGQEKPSSTLHRNVLIWSNDQAPSGSHAKQLCCLDGCRDSRCVKRRWIEAAECPVSHLHRIMISLLFLQKCFFGTTSPNTYSIAVVQSGFHLQVYMTPKMDWWISQSEESAIGPDGGLAPLAPPAPRPHAALRTDRRSEPCSPWFKSNKAKVFLHWKHLHALSSHAFLRVHLKGERFHGVTSAVVEKSYCRQVVALELYRKQCSTFQGCQMCKKVTRIVYLLACIPNPVSTSVSRTVHLRTNACTLLLQQQHAGFQGSFGETPGNFRLLGSRDLQRSEVTSQNYRLMFRCLTIWRRSPVLTPTRARTRQCFIPISALGQRGIQITQSAGFHVGEAPHSISCSCILFGYLNSKYGFMAFTECSAEIYRPESCFLDDESSFQPLSVSSELLWTAQGPFCLRGAFSEPRSRNLHAEKGHKSWTKCWISRSFSAQWFEFDMSQGHEDINIALALCTEDEEPVSYFAWKKQFTPIARTHCISQEFAAAEEKKSVKVASITHFLCSTRCLWKYCCIYEWSPSSDVVV